MNRHLAWPGGQDGLAAAVPLEWVTAILKPGANQVVAAYQDMGEKHMRTFEEVRSALVLEEFLDSAKGTLYCGPSGASVPEIMVRRFDGCFSDDLVQSYVGINEAVREWLGDRPDFAKFVVLEALIEIGADFVSRPFHVYQTSLSVYDDRVDRSEVPEEIDQMREALERELGKSKSERDVVVEKVLGQSLLGAASKTYFNWGSRVFWMVELSLGCDDLRRWAEIYGG